MNPILDFLNNKLFKRNAKKYLSTLTDIIKLRATLHTTQDELNRKTLDFMKDSAKDTYISIFDLCFLIESGQTDLESVLQHTKHVSEFAKANKSVIDVFAVVENDHVTLCANPKECDQHKNCAAEKLQIVTVR